MYSVPYPGAYYAYPPATPVTPSPAAYSAYYSPRHSTMPTPVSPRRSSHSRRASVNVEPTPFFGGQQRPYASPQYAPGYYSSPAYPSPQYVPPPQQEPESQPRQERPRRASTSRPTSRSREPPKPAKATPKATAADAERHQIPAGFSTKNWDPEEEPIVLLGSVFDANSLGKWIYDWTVYNHGGASEQADMAGDLWLLLIQLAGKMKRADEALDKIRAQDRHDMVADFIESGERLMDRFRRLLKNCEEYMMKAARKESAARRDGAKEKVSMGKASGVEFVLSVFGEDRELSRTEKLMAGMRIWNTRWDANCEEILRRPSKGAP